MNRRVHSLLNGVSLLSVLADCRYISNDIVSEIHAVILRERRHEKLFAERTVYVYVL